MTESLKPFTLEDELTSGSEIYVLVGMNDNSPRYDYICKIPPIVLNTHRDKLINEINIRITKKLSLIFMTDDSFDFSYYKLFITSKNEVGGKPNHRVTKRKNKKH